MRIHRHSQIAATMNIHSEAASEAIRTALTKLGEQLK